MSLIAIVDLSWLSFCTELLQTHSAFVQFSILGCCEFDFETTEVDLPDDNSQYSLEVEGCCEARSK